MPWDSSPRPLSERARPMKLNASNPSVWAKVRSQSLCPLETASQELAVWSGGMILARVREVLGSIPRTALL